VAKLQSDKGKELVKAHKGDAQKICDERRKHCLQSAGADISAGNTMEHITTARLGSAPWNGTTHSFVLHFVEQMRLHSALVGSADQIPEGMKCAMLKKAVFNHGELPAVDNMNKVLATQTGKPATCESHCALLLSAALQVEEVLFAMEISAQNSLSQRIAGKIIAARSSNGQARGAREAAVTACHDFIIHDSDVNKPGDADSSTQPSAPPSSF
jgi:hypothetical protein